MLPNEKELFESKKLFPFSNPFNVVGDDSLTDLEKGVLIT